MQESNFDILENFLEPYRIPDEISANEYESTPAAVRSLIKTAVAFHFSENPFTDEKEIFVPRSFTGFCKGFSRKRAAFALAAIDADYRSPAKFLSVVCQAVLAGIQEIYIFIDPKMPQEKFHIFLTCFELCGLENIFFLPEEKELEKTAELLKTAYGQTGKILLFAEQKQYMHTLSSKNVFKENYPVKILACERQKEFLELAYGCAGIVFSEKSVCPASPKEHFETILNAETDGFDVSFCAERQAKLNLGEGLEFCFRHPRLPEDFFCETLGFYSLENSYEPKTEQ